MGCDSSKNANTVDQVRQASKAPMEVPIKEVLQHVKSNEFHENNENTVKLEMETEKNEVSLLWFDSPISLLVHEGKPGIPRDRLSTALFDG